MLKSDRMKSLFTKTVDESRTILETLHFVVNIQVSVENRLPNQICCDCESTLYTAEAFKRRCLNSERLLSEQYQISNLSKVSEKDSSKPVEITHEDHDTTTSVEPLHKTNDRILPFPVFNDKNLKENCLESVILRTDVKTESFNANLSCEEFDEPLNTIICEKETIYLKHTDTDEKLMMVTRNKNLKGENLQQEKSHDSDSRKTKKVLVKCKKNLSTNEADIINNVEETLQSDRFDINSAVAAIIGAKNLELDIMERIHICQTCKKGFKLASQLRNHNIKVHVRGNRKDIDFECEICKESFPLLWILNKHMRSHSEDAFIHICPECGKKLRNKYYLEEHMMRHKGVKPFQCDQCDNSFVTKMELTMHKRRHNGEMPFSCEQCGRKFRAYSSLVRHRRTHTGERPYKCDICPKSFAESGTRNEHRRIHTGEKPFVCQYCDQKFNKRHHLKTHLAQHGEGPKKSKGQGV